MLVWIPGMSKAEILAELPRLSLEERPEALEKIQHLNGLAGDEWLESTALTDAEKELLEARLRACGQSRNAGSTWEDVEARIRGRLKA